MTPGLRALMVAAHGEKETAWCESTANYCCSYHEGWSDGQEAAVLRTEDDPMAQDET